MRVRAIDGNHDWLFGKGQNDYRTARAAVAQMIDTRLSEFLGDCFFNNGAGVDWLTLLGSKDQAALNLSITTIILNTQDVIFINQLQTDLPPSTRRLTVRYQVQTSYGVVNNSTDIVPTSL